MSFFRFCWKNEKIDWPKCARTREPMSESDYDSDSSYDPTYVQDSSDSD